MSHTQSLFPKSKRVVSLEELLNENVKVNREKYRKCFMVICEDIFSTNHFGEYNVRRFKRKTGLNTDRFFQKVILSLSLMDYIKGIKCNYSSGNHGYIYQVNYLKLKGLDKDLWSYEPNQVTDLFEEYEWVDTEHDQDREYTDVEKEWLVEKQLNTIKSMSIDRKVFQSEMEKKDEILSDPTKKTWNSKELHHINNLEKLYHRRKSRMTIKIDGDDGRLYSVMTNLKSQWRKDGTLHIKGEGFCEVDMSSLHPTLFGLMVREKYPQVHSQWVEHCLEGDFYEWVMDITGICKNSVTSMKNELYKIVGVYVRSDDTNRKSMKNKMNKHRELNDTIDHKMKELEVSVDDDITDEMKKQLFRPVVKQWVMGYLFSSFRMKSTEKNGDTIYKQFCHNLCKYLKEEEPYIYETLVWYRSKENLIPKKKNPEKKTSQLPYIFQKQEVRFIKRCLKEVDREVEYLYTVHDCIGCLVSDGEKVKKIMERVSEDMYGVRLKMKIGGEVWDNQLWKLVS